MLRLHVAAVLQSATHQSATAFAPPGAALRLQAVQLLAALPLLAADAVQLLAAPLLLAAHVPVPQLLLPLLQPTLQSHQQRSSSVPTGKTQRLVILWIASRFALVLKTDGSLPRCP